MAINVIFNDFSYEILPKRLETYNKYCKILRWGRRNPTRFMEQFMGLQFNDYQKYCFLGTWRAATSVLLMSRSSGKALALDTPVYRLKEDGEWEKTTMGEVKVGDRILGGDGKPTEILQTKPVIFEFPYLVEFRDGEQVECNGEHLWMVWDDVTNKWRTMETYEIYQSLVRAERRVNFFVPTLEGEKKAIVRITREQRYKPMRCLVVDNDSGLFVCGENQTVTHNSYLSAPLMMAWSLLVPNTHVYIMAPTGNQAQETFTKLENLAKGNITSAIGVSSFFLDEAVRQNAKADPFTHDSSSYQVSLYNGSTINTLNSVAKGIVGIRSNFSCYDEAGKIDRDFYALTLPFSVQDTNFITGNGINTELYPLQLPNKNLFLSSAEGIDSELFDRYKICFEKMLMGDPNYFVADISCEFSLHPFLDGKPTRPLVTEATIQDAFKVNPFRAKREYYNIFDKDGSQDSLVKRSTIIRYSQTFFPEFENPGGKKYIIAYDPSTKIDNAIIMVGELFRDEVKGWMVRLVNCNNLLDLLPSGETMVMQKPDQIEKLKDMIVDYNKGGMDYEFLDMLIIDAGAGGGGTDIAQFMMKEWLGKDNKYHLGFIDQDDPYMKLRADDYPLNSEKLRMFNFKRDKVAAYERTQNAINQGLVIFPTAPNTRGEIEFEVDDPDGGAAIRYEKLSYQEKNALQQLDLAKEELVGTEKEKRPNGAVQFNLSAEAKSSHMHDDRADCVAMICHRLMEIRADEALNIIHEGSKFSDFFAKAGQRIGSNNAGNRLGAGANPFANRAGGGMFRH